MQSGSLPTLAWPPSHATGGATLGAGLRPGAASLSRALLHTGSIAKLVARPASILFVLDFSARHIAQRSDSTAPYAEGPGGVLLFLPVFGTLLLNPLAASGT
jgi:hypothetical protein